MPFRTFSIIIAFVSSLVLLVLTVLPAAAHTNDPQPCDDRTSQMTVATARAAIHSEPRLDAPPTGSVPADTHLLVTERQADGEVGCWYHVATPDGTLPARGWIAGSTVRVVAWTMTDRTPTPVANAASTATPTPRVPGYVAPFAPLPTSGGQNATTTPVPSAPVVSGDPSTPRVEPTPNAGPASTPTAPVVGGTNAFDTPVPHTVRIKVCLDANANTNCDVGEGVAGLPAYVVTDSGHILARTRTDGAGEASVVIQVAPSAQRAVNVPYVNAYQRFTGLVNPQPFVLPNSAAIPGILPY